MTSMGAHQTSLPRVHFWPLADRPLMAAFDPFLPLAQWLVFDPKPTLPRLRANPLPTLASYPLS